MDEMMPADKFKEVMNKVVLESDNVTNVYWYLQYMVSVYVVVMMLRFFKSFRANPRLNVVTQTITDGATDIMHFGIVFMTIFVAFAVAAQVLFGARMKDFSSLIRSINMGWRILMGEFDFEGMSVVNYNMAMIWFWGFEILMLLILFNMLLAIVMDTYA